MKHLLLPIYIFISVLSFGNTYAKSGINIEMYLMRKGSKVNIVLLSKGTEAPRSLEIERKSTAPLSNYRKILMLSAEQLLVLSTEKKIILSDNYPESRQLESYYRLKITTKGGVLKTPPAIFLNKASGDQSVTFGDHKQDAIMFETVEEKEIIRYEQYNMTFNVRRENTKVLITLSGGKNLEGTWFLQRKSSKPLATFRRIKSITTEDQLITRIGDHVFIDKYPESAQLDAYYRLMVITKDGEEIILPSILLYKTTAGR